MTDVYKTILSSSEGFFKDRGSKFFAHAYHVENQTEISDSQKVLRKKYHDARHHCYAYMLGELDRTSRANDDGEPANSSGAPILGQIRSFELTNILIIVVRYFGGTKLGIPGLINAYKSAAADSIANAKIVERTIDDSIEFRCTYNDINQVMRLVKELEMTIISQNMEQECSLTARLRKSLTPKLQKRLENYPRINMFIN